MDEIQHNSIKLILLMIIATVSIVFIRNLQIFHADKTTSIIATISTSSVNNAAYFTNPYYKTIFVMMNSTQYTLPQCKKLVEFTTFLDVDKDTYLWQKQMLEINGTRIYREAPYCGAENVFVFFKTDDNNFKPGSNMTDYFISKMYEGNYTSLYACDSTTQVINSRQ